jgi:hypothetical protein
MPARLVSSEIVPGSARPAGPPIVIESGSTFGDDPPPATPGVRFERTPSRRLSHDGGFGPFDDAASRDSSFALSSLTAASSHREHDFGFQSEMDRMRELSRRGVAVTPAMADRRVPVRDFDFDFDLDRRGGPPMMGPRFGPSRGAGPGPAAHHHQHHHHPLSDSVVEQVDAMFNDAVARQHEAHRREAGAGERQWRGLDVPVPYAIGPGGRFVGRPVLARVPAAHAGNGADEDPPTIEELNHIRAMIRVLACASNGWASRIFGPDMADRTLAEAVQWFGGAPIRGIANAWVDAGPGAYSGDTYGQEHYQQQQQQQQQQHRNQQHRNQQHRNQHHMLEDHDTPDDPLHALVMQRCGFNDGSTTDLWRAQVVCDLPAGEMGAILADPMRYPAIGAPRVTSTRHSGSFMGFPVFSIAFGSNAFPMGMRDYAVAVVDWGLQSDGSYVVLLSTPTSGPPPVPGYRRGRMLIGGFVCTPLEDNPHRCVVTSIALVEAENWAPGLTGDELAREWVLWIGDAARAIGDPHAAARAAGGLHRGDPRRFNLFNNNDGDDDEDDGFFGRRSRSDRDPYGRRRGPRFVPWFGFYHGTEPAVYGRPPIEVPEASRRAPIEDIMSKYDPELKKRRANLSAGARGQQANNNNNNNNINNNINNRNRPASRFK